MKVSKAFHSDNRLFSLSHCLSTCPNFPTENTVFTEKFLFTLTTICTPKMHVKTNPQHDVLESGNFGR